MLYFWDEPQAKLRIYISFFQSPFLQPPFFQPQFLQPPAVCPMTDQEIARQAPILPITEIAARLNIAPDALDLYGRYKAKIPLDYTRAEGQIGAGVGHEPHPAG